MAGWLYGLWWRVPLHAVWWLPRAPIAALELLTVCINVLIFGPVLAAASSVVLETDALAAEMVLVARARHSGTMAVLHEGLLASAEYRALTAPRSRLA
eukprot:6140224-Pleurochrysis_carterae.AAC.1